MDVYSQVDYHQTLLDRCTLLIAACDSKASFALSFVGVIIGVTVSRIPENPINADIFSFGMPSPPYVYHKINTNLK